MLRRVWPVRCLPLVLALPAITGCTDPTAPVGSRGSPDTSVCRWKESIPDDSVPVCLLRRGVVSKHARRSADSIIARANAVRDSLAAAGAASAHNQLARMLHRLSSFYARDQFPDSQRFLRVVTHIDVMTDFVRGLVPRIGGVTYRPRQTPMLTWVFYDNFRLLNFQPVSSVQCVDGRCLVRGFPDTTLATDSLRALADALWAFRVDDPFPKFELHFDWSAEGYFRSAPWQGALGQGLVLGLFTELYARTGDAIWKARADSVFVSYTVGWDHGGVRLMDAHWWEEYHPQVRVWNGSVNALHQLGYFARATGNGKAARMFELGVAEVKRTVHWYDDGRWTFYSLMRGYNTKAYHAVHIRLMDQLYDLTQDPWFRATADRWRAYVPPPGVV